MLLQCSAAAAKGHTSGTTPICPVSWCSRLLVLQRRRPWSIARGSVRGDMKLVYDRSCQCLHTARTWDPERDESPPAVGGWEWCREWSHTILRRWDPQDAGYVVDFFLQCPNVPPGSVAQFSFHVPVPHYVQVPTEWAWDAVGATVWGLWCWVLANRPGRTNIAYNVVNRAVFESVNLPVAHQ
jgi:hypothetical protein